MNEERPAVEIVRPRGTSFHEIDSWVFDLDNTLYPASSRIFDQIHRRMGEYITQVLKVDPAEAARIQKAMFREYGTTLRGLMTVHGIDPDGFLEHVHRIDLSTILPDPNLPRALAALRGRKLVFTNATAKHARNILSHLGIAEHFEDIFDIAAANYVPKPDPAPYASMLAQFGLDPRRTAMIEDMACNLAPAAALGMTTVWVRGDFEWARRGADGDHIHHVAEELASWLAGIAAERNGGPAGV